MFNVLVAGDLKGEKLDKIVDELIGQLKAFLYDSGKRSKTKIFVSDEYTSEGWKEKIHLSDNHICAVSDVDTDKWNGDSKLKIETDVRRVVGEVLCNKADLVIAVWDESVTEMNGATWELIQLARGNKTPLIWISSKTYEIHWCEASFYEEYTPEKMKNICDLYNETELQPEIEKDKRIPLLWFGNFWHKCFMKKNSKHIDSESGAVDSIMLDDFNEMDVDSAGEKQRKTLLEAFHRYEKVAVKYNSKFKSAMYWRSILPIIITIFIAIGFYADPLFTYGVGKKNVWIMVAGIGFLIHGLLNLYDNDLKKSSVIREWQKAFVESRFAAEVLRVLVHFEPYGFSLNLKKLCGSNNKIYRTVKNASENDGSFVVNEESSKHLLFHLKEMLDGQVAYHKNSVKKYDRIVSKLEKWVKFWVVFGFIIVVVRAGYQFFVTIRPIGGDAERYGVTLNSFLKSFMNMLALVIPAVASYLSSKLAKNRFKFNYENHKKMEEKLSILEVRVEKLMKLDSPIKMEILASLGDEVAQTMLVEDAFMWFSQHRAQQ